MEIFQIFTLLGAEIGEYKTEFLKRICTHPEEFRNVESHTEYVTEENIDLVQSYIDNLPDCIQKHFVDGGEWKVYIVNSMPNGVKGRVVVEEKAVYIVSGYELDHLYHEFAHIYLHNNPLDDEFKAIYEEEAEQMIKAYYGDEMYSASNPTEFFCSAWNIVYTTSGHDVEGVAPKTFAYFVELFGRLYNCN